MNRTKIIAEIGVNHNGNIKKAKKLITVAKKIGADAVKFQTYVTDELVIKKSPLAKYQKKTLKKTITQYDLLKKYELSFSQIKELKNFCDKSKIEFITSIFDIKSLEYVLKLGVKNLKIPSGENDNLPLLSKLRNYKNNIIISTGMSSLTQIDDIVDFFKKIKVKKKFINVLLCTSEYPCKHQDLNLGLIPILKKKYNLEIGFSDHTKGIEASISAVTLGANIIEKHFTLDKNLPGPDHKSSLEPREFEYLIKSIRNVEKGIKINKKLISKGEKENSLIVRKSIYALKDIKKGEKFSENNICLKRPGYGLSPQYWNKIINKKSKKKYLKDDLIKK